MPDGGASGAGVLPTLVLGGASARATRLVRDLLSGYDALSTDHEFPHLRQLVELRRRMRDSIARGFIDLFCGDAELDAGLRRLLAGVFAPRLPDAGGRLLCEATPGNVHVLPDLAELLPDARFVHVLCDPREAVAERLADGRSGPPWRRLEGAIGEVRLALEAGFEAARRFPERVLPLRVEDLLGRSATGLERLEAFLAVQGRPPGRPPASGHAPRWPRLLSPGQKVVSSRAFADHPQLADAGYVLSSGDLGLPVRALGVTAQALWSAADRLERRARRSARAWRDAP